MGLVTLSSDAVMLLLPGAVLEAVASPLASIVKAFVLEDSHVAVVVMSNLLPPLSTPVALNC
jgi:hypothetical protein